VVGVETEVRSGSLRLSAHLARPDPPAGPGPNGLVGKIPPRPLLLLHGSDDDVVPLMDARTLADAADGQVELRVISGAGHGLRHDPRAVAVLMGWMERQGV